MGNHHHAKIVAPLKGFILGMSATLPIGTEIRKVAVANGGYTCEACTTFGVKPESKDSWHRFVTQEDLPAFTDKGREGRAKRGARASASDMQVGRPTKSNAPATTTLSIRLTHAQKRQLVEGSKKSDVTISEAVLGSLVMMGLVTR